MKTGKKIISLLLCALLALSSLPLFASAGEVLKGTTIEASITNNGLADVVDSLLQKISTNKATVTGAALRIVFLVMKDGSDDMNKALAAEIEKTGKAVIDLTDEQAAKVLLDWLQVAFLPLIEEKLNGLDSSLVNVIKNLTGINLSNFKTINGLLSELYNAGESGIIHAFGDLSKLTSKSLRVPDKKILGIQQYRAIQRKDGDLKVVYALLDWLNEISPLAESFVKGGIGKGGLNPGNLVNLLKNNIDSIGDAIDNINNMVKNLTPFIKSMIYKVLDGDASSGSFDADPVKAAGDWGKSEYKNHTADQMLAAFVVNLLNGKNGEKPVNVVPAAECNELLGKDVYTFISNVVESLYKTYLVDMFNGGLLDGVKGVIRDYNADIAEVFNADYINGTAGFTADSFNEVFAKANQKDSCFIEQMNEVLMVFANVMLKPEVIRELGLTAGDNSNFNTNVEKILKKGITYFGTAEVKEKLGIDYSAYTAKAVAKMSAEDVATAIIKGFFKPMLGFTDEQVAKYVAPCTDLEQLFALIMDRVYATKLPENVATAAGTAALENDYANVAKRSDSENIDAVMTNTAKVAAYALATIDILGYTYTVPETASTEMDYFNSIADSMLYLVRGIPAINTTNKLYEASSGKKDAYYKVDAVVNNLIDMSFIQNSVGRDFDWDIENYVKESVVGNLLDFDLAGIFDLFARDNSSTFALSLQSFLMGLVDRILNSVFVANTSLEHHAAKGEYVETSKTDSTCTENGKTVYTCPRCDADTYETVIPAKGHTGGAADCVTLAKCTVCGEGYGSVDTNNHKSKAVKDAGIDATCTENGLTEGSHCPDCNAVFTAQTVVNALGHNPVAGNGVEATCTTDGITAGLVCSVCNEVFEAQETIPAFGHTSDDGVITKEATPTETGEKTYSCVNCGTVLMVEELPATELPLISTETAQEVKGEYVYANAATTAGEIAAAVEGTVVTKADGSAVEADSAISTGMVATKADGTAVVIVVLGDVDGDGEVKAADARLALRRAVNLETFEEGSAQYTAANVEAISEGVVAAADARIILRASVGLEDSKAWISAYKG